MAANNLPMPIMVSDLLAETDNYSAKEFGALMLLVMAYWWRGEPLWSDERKLRGVVRMSVDEWGEVRTKVLAFFQERNGALHSDWLDELMGFAIKEARRESRPPYISPAIRSAVREIFAGKCVYCGTEAGAFDVDHIIPWSRGGDHAMSNFAWACAPCNRSKKHMTPEEWGGRRQ